MATMLTAFLINTVPDLDQECTTVPVVSVSNLCKYFYRNCQLFSVAVSVAISQLDSLIEEMESMNNNCQQKHDQDIKSDDDNDKIDLENQLDQLTEKLKNAMEAGVEVKDSLGNII